jgi:DNA-binding response OmpR family regulator
MTTVLIVDDDPQVNTLLEQFLVGEGFGVVIASGGSEALELISTVEPDLVLLDIGLGSEDGREILGEIKIASDVPIIFLTGRALESERIAGLKLGADDYIVKPFSLGEVVARIESVLRRVGVNPVRREIERATRKFGDLEINETTHEVKLAGVVIELTLREFALLSFLASSPRQVFSRQQLLDELWDHSEDWQNEAKVTEHIRRLRAKLEADPNRPMWITTVRGVGYRFNPPIGS